MRYDEMLEVAERENLKVHEVDLKLYDGLIKNRTILIRRTLPTRARKAEILAEEVGHARTCCGDILDYKANSKQEVEGRTVGYDLLVGLDGIIRAFREGCVNVYEMAECLGVTEEFLTEALERYKGKYAPYTEHDGYCIVFEPYLAVIKKL